MCMYQKRTKCRHNAYKKIYVKRSYIFYSVHVSINALIFENNDLMNYTFNLRQSACKY